MGDSKLIITDQAYPGFELGRAVVATRALQLPPKSARTKRNRGSRSRPAFGKQSRHRRSPPAPAPPNSPHPPSRRPPPPHFAPLCWHRAGRRGVGSPTNSRRCSFSFQAVPK